MERQHNDRAIWGHLTLKAIDAVMPLIHKSLKTQGAFAERLKYARLKSAYCARTDDIFIATYPKSGTTLVQMILYQLTTDGGMGIAHLNQFVPYLEDLANGDPDAVRATRTDPEHELRRRRIIKTHVTYRDIPKGCGRYIYVVRDGRDVAVSYYYHYKRNGYGKSFPEFLGEFIRGEVRFGSWFDHVAAWTENSSQLGILFLRFENLLADLPGSIRTIAGFCEIPVRDQDLPRVIERCSFEFMREHEAKLDVKTRKSSGLDPAQDHFIRKGRPGDWKEHFDKAMLVAYDAKWSSCGPGFAVVVDSALRVAERGRCATAQ